MLAADYPLLDVFWTMLGFFLFVMWIWVLIAIFSDIFRSQDLGGWGKAGWFCLVLFLPVFGVLMYLVTRGDNMQTHAIEDAQAQDAALRGYVKSVVPEPTPADELAKLADLHDKGVINDAEYETQRSRVLA